MSRSKVHFQIRVDFRFFAFGVGIFAKRLLWRPERNPLYFELCEYNESVIVERMASGSVLGIW